MLKRPKIGEVVLVEWEDHYSHAKGWQHLDDNQKDTDHSLYVWSAGIVTAVHKEKLVLVANAQQSSKEFMPKVSDSMVILRRCIKSIKVLHKGLFKK